MPAVASIANNIARSSTVWCHPIGARARMQGSIAKVTSKTPASVEERNRRLGTSEASDRVNGRPGIISKAAGLQEAAYVD
jgi:hypothetical protein